MAQITRAALQRQAQQHPQRIVTAVLCVLLVFWLFSPTSVLPESSKAVAAVSQPSRTDAQQLQQAPILQPPNRNTVAGLLSYEEAIVPALHPFDPKEPPYDFREPDASYMFFNHYDKKTSGVVIMDMLLMHAYSYQQGKVYGGSCGRDPHAYEKHGSLMEALGLESFLQFQCANDLGEDEETRRRTIPDAEFQRDDTQIFTQEYRAYLRSLVRYPPRSDTRFTIAVHIRRGKNYDTPCSRSHKPGFEKYLTNAHYQRLIDLYMQPNARVVIYSSTPSSAESLDEFRRKGYELHVDEDAGEAWKTMATSDVLVMSRSLFSLIPALVHRGRVVYTPFWRKPLDSWDVVSDALMAVTRQEVQDLRISMGCS